MQLEEILEPILITYNRKELLNKTLNQLVADNSPIRECQIIILDNASDDGTQELCENFVKCHQNFKYIRNPKNVGIAGNIIKSMELVSKKWLWVICDDDYFHWKCWSEVEKALFEDYDIVMTNRNGIKCEYPYLINEASFLPNAIYNTKHINETTIKNAYGIAHTLLPHHAITCKVINEKGKIFSPENYGGCVAAGNNDVNKKDYVNQKDENLYFKYADYNIIQGYVNAYRLIKDEKVRQECMEVLCQGETFKNSMAYFLQLNPKGSLDALFEVLISSNKRQMKDLIGQIMFGDDITRKNYCGFVMFNMSYLIINYIKSIRKLIIKIGYNSDYVNLHIFNMHIKIKNNVIIKKMYEWKKRHAKR